MLEFNYILSSSASIIYNKIPNWIDRNSEELSQSAASSWKSKENFFQSENELNESAKTPQENLSLTHSLPLNKFIIKIFLMYKELRERKKQLNRKKFEINYELQCEKITLILSQCSAQCSICCIWSGNIPKLSSHLQNFNLSLSLCCKFSSPKFPRLIFSILHSKYTLHEWL